MSYFRPAPCLSINQVTPRVSFILSLQPGQAALLTGRPSSSQVFLPASLGRVHLGLGLIAASFLAHSFVLLLTPFTQTLQKDGREVNFWFLPCLNDFISPLHFIAGLVGFGVLGESHFPPAGWRPSLLPPSARATRVWCQLFLWRGPVMAVLRCPDGVPRMHRGSCPHSWTFY